MVKFKMVLKTDKEIIYEYYPENDRTCEAGLIRIDLIALTIEVLKPAERDVKSICKEEKLNSMREHINEMRVENGELTYSEDELPTATEDSEFYYYASHVINKIDEAHDEGIFLEEGTVAWY